jgi:hypothetical protein
MRVQALVATLRWAEAQGIIARNPLPGIGLVLDYFGSGGAPMTDVALLQTADTLSVQHSLVWPNLTHAPTANVAL